jgi:uncharacterized damage-inducible protein DinB
MRRDPIVLLYRYNHWATDRVLTAASGMSAEQLEVAGHAGHGSVRETFIHLLETQRAWISWLDGSMEPMAAMRRRIDRESVRTVADIRAHWRAIEEQTFGLLERLTEEELESALHMETPWIPATERPMWTLLVHVANHGTQHRSEIAAMLTEHGHSPGYLDVLFYLLESPEYAPTHA